MTELCVILIQSDTFKTKSVYFILLKYTLFVLVTHRRFELRTP